MSSIKLCYCPSPSPAPLPLQNRKDLISLKVEVKGVRRSNMASGSCLRKIARFQLQRLHFSSKPFYSSSAKVQRHETSIGSDGDDAAVPTAGISRPLSEILKDLNKKVPESLLKARSEPSGSSLRYIPWYLPSLHFFLINSFRI